VYGRGRRVLNGPISNPEDQSAQLTPGLVPACPTQILFLFTAIELGKSPGVGVVCSNRRSVGLDSGMANTEIEFDPALTVNRNCSHMYSSLLVISRKTT
jgi:hypothetical protein